MNIFWILSVCLNVLTTFVSGIELCQVPELARFLEYIITLQRHVDCTPFFIRQAASQVNTLEEFVISAVVNRVTDVVPYFNLYFDSRSLNNVRNRFTEKQGRLYSRRGDSCKLVLVLVHEVKFGFLEGIKKTFTGPYLPIIANHIDPWIWITSQPSQLEPLLLSQILPAHTKYKLGISFESSTSRNLVIKSVCFFCDDGRPQIVTHLPSQPDYFPDYVTNLRGKLVRVSFCDVESLIYADPPYTGVNNAKRGVWKGYLNEHLVPKFNCTYNAFMSTGRGSGLKLPNGTWIGTVGDVLSGKADVGITTAHTPDRIQAVSFTSSFMDVSYLVLVKGHGTQIFSLFAFLKPFDEVMWICLGISTLVAFLTFKMISEWMKRIHGTDSWTIQRQIGFILTSYLDQGFAPGIPKFTPLRCFIGLWFCFGIVITTIYKSKMVGLLAFPTLEQVPETFKELVDSEYQVGFPFHGNAAYNTLKASTNPVYVKLVKNMEIITGSGLDCLERVAKTDKSACILYLGSDAYLRAANLSDSDIRKLVYAPETVFNVFIGLILEPGSIYKEGFERWMSWTRPFHLPHLWNVHDLYYNLRLPKRAWWLETGQMDKLKTSVKETDVNLTLKHISGAFYFLVGCHLISSLHFTVEILWSRFKPFFKRFHKK